MDRRLVLSVCVAAVLLSVAHGYPQEASAEVPALRAPLDDLTKVSALEDAKTSPAEKTAEKRESPVLPKSEPAATLGTKLNVHFPPTEGDKSVLALKEEDDDSVRSPRQSPSMSFGRGPHATTVCIQIRSDHPEVVCGPQVPEEKKIDPSSARYAYPEYYARAPPQYPMRYAQQPPPLPTPIMAPIYPARRREEEIKPMEQIIPQPPPLRGIQAPPMVLHRPLYQPVMSAGLYPQTSQLLRLNCGVQPESSQLFNSPLFRSSSPMLMGYYPVGEQVVTLQDPSRLDPLLPRELNPLRARMAASDILNLESPYAYSTADPWSGSAYLGESGFYPMDMQGRSAGSGLDQQYSNTFTGYPSESSMDEFNRNLLQEQELQQSRLRLRMLQNQLKELHQRSSADEDLKNIPASDPQDNSSPVQEQKKDQAARLRQGKRQTRSKEI